MRDGIVSLKMVEGMLFFGILWVIQCYQQFQVFFAHVNLQNVTLLLVGTSSYLKLLLNLLERRSLRVG